MSIQQAPQLKLEKLNAPAEPIGIVQEYNQSIASKIKAERFSIKQEQKIAQTPVEVTKIGELNRDASTLVRERLRKDGLNPEGKPLLREQKTSPNNIKHTNENSSSKPERFGNIEFKKGKNDVMFRINPNLSKDQQIMERDNFAKKIVSENQGNQYKFQNKLKNGVNIYRILFKNPIK